jgi:hypothetical protein
MLSVQRIIARFSNSNFASVERRQFLQNLRLRSKGIKENYG